MERIINRLSRFFEWISDRVLRRPSFDRIDGSDFCSACGGDDVVEGLWRSSCADCGHSEAGDRTELMSRISALPG